MKVKKRCWWIKKVDNLDTVTFIFQFLDDFSVFSFQEGALSKSDAVLPWSASSGLQVKKKAILFAVRRICDRQGYCRKPNFLFSSSIITVILVGSSLISSFILLNAANV